MLKNITARGPTAAYIAILASIEKKILLFSELWRENASMRNTSGSTLAYRKAFIVCACLLIVVEILASPWSLLVIGVGVLFFIIHEQKDDLRILKTITAVSKTLAKKESEIEKRYEELVESANRVALAVELDHNVISDSHEYIYRKNIRIRGLPELQDRAVIDMFKELCAKKLGVQLEDNDIDQGLGFEPSRPKSCTIWASFKTLKAIWSGPAQRDGTRPATITFSSYVTKKEVIEKARLKLRDTPYVMFDDVFMGSGENLTQIAHDKQIDACYQHISKVWFRKLEVWLKGY